MNEPKPCPVPLSYEQDSGELHHEGAVVVRMLAVDDFPCLTRGGLQRGGVIR
jgi:hypothetical protein